jgi:hypothetical protein
MADTGALRAPVSNGVRVRLPPAALFHFLRKEKEKIDPLPTVLSAHILPL